MTFNQFFKDYWFAIVVLLFSITDALCLKWIKGFISSYSFPDGEFHLFLSDMNSVNGAALGFFLTTFVLLLDILDKKLPNAQKLGLAGRIAKFGFGLITFTLFNFLLGLYCRWFEVPSASNYFILYIYSFLIWVAYFIQYLIILFVFVSEAYSPNNNR